MMKKISLLCVSALITGCALLPFPQVVGKNDLIYANQFMEPDYTYWSESAKNVDSANLVVLPVQLDPNFKDIPPLSSDDYIDAAHYLSEALPLLERVQLAQVSKLGELSVLPATNPHKNSGTVNQVFHYDSDPYFTHSQRARVHFSTFRDNRDNIWQYSSPEYKNTWDYASKAVLPTGDVEQRNNNVNVLAVWSATDLWESEFSQSSQPGMFYQVTELTIGEMVPAHFCKNLMTGEKYVCSGHGLDNKFYLSKDRLVSESDANSDSGERVNVIMLVSQILDSNGKILAARAEPIYPILPKKSLFEQTLASVEGGWLEGVTFDMSRTPDPEALSTHFAAAMSDVIRWSQNFGQ